MPGGLTTSTGSDGLEADSAGDVSGTPSNDFFFDFLLKKPPRRNPFVFAFLAGLVPMSEPRVAAAAFLASANGF